MRVQLSAFQGLLESKVMIFPDGTPEEITITLPIAKEFTNAKCKFNCLGSTGNVDGAIFKYALTDIELVRI